MSKNADRTVTPEPIMQTAMGFWAAKVLFSAVKLDLFTFLGDERKSAREIQDALGIHDRAIHDFLDSLVALGFLERKGLREQARYGNAPEARRFLVRGEPTYIGGFLEMANDRLYRFWGDLEEGLRSGEPQNEAKHGEADLFDRLYDDPKRLEQFLAAMASLQMGAFTALTARFDFSPYETLLDLGGASGALSIQVARHHKHMRCITVDLPPAEPIARQRIREAGLEDRVSARTLDFWEDELPAVDVITMGNILHDWGLAEKKNLIRKSFEALNDGGVLIVIENLIDDERRENVFGLLMSLNMLIETRKGFDFTGADFADWASEAGFRNTDVIPLAGPASAAVAYK